MRSRRNETNIIARMRDRIRPAPEPRHRVRDGSLVAAAVGGGALLEYFFDPDQGRGRRTRARDRFVGLVRSSARKEQRLARRVRSDVYGLRQRITHRTPADTMPDDATLSHKIESEILGQRWVDKSRININSEKGIVVLRGEVDRPELMEKLERAIRRVPGVVEVRNLLHLKNTEPQNKTAALEASGRAQRSRASGT